jgi:hypothetical protein
VCGVLIAHPGMRVWAFSNIVARTRRIIIGKIIVLRVQQESTVKTVPYVNCAPMVSVRLYEVSHANLVQVEKNQ